MASTTWRTASAIRSGDSLHGSEVPELLSDRGFDDVGRTVRAADDSTLNEVDENAVEAALALADQFLPAVNRDAGRKYLQAIGQALSRGHCGGL